MSEACRWVSLIVVRHGRCSNPLEGLVILGGTWPGILTFICESPMSHAQFFDRDLVGIRKAFRVALVNEDIEAAIDFCTAAISCEAVWGLEDPNQADDPPWTDVFDRGMLYCAIGKYESALCDYSLCCHLSQMHPFPLSVLAGFMSTCEDDRYYCPGTALYLAERAETATGLTHAGSCFVTLCKAYALIASERFFDAASVLCSVDLHGIHPVTRGEHAMLTDHAQRGVRIRRQQREYRERVLKIFHARWEMEE